MNILLVPLVAATVFLFIKRNKSPHYKKAFIVIGIATLALLVITAGLAIAMRGIKA